MFLDKDADIIYSGSSIPKLKDVRGKIVLVNFGDNGDLDQGLYKRTSERPSKKNTVEIFWHWLHYKMFFNDFNLAVFLMTFQMELSHLHQLKMIGHHIAGKFRSKIVISTSKV